MAASALDSFELNENIEMARSALYTAQDVLTKRTVASKVVSIHEKKATTKAQCNYLCVGGRMVKTQGTKPNKLTKHR